MVGVAGVAAGAGCQFRASPAAADGAPPTADAAPRLDAARGDAAGALDGGALDATPTGVVACGGGSAWLDETFAGTTPCDWQFGPFTNGATLAQGSGELSISVNDVNVNAGCTLVPHPVTSAGVIVHVTRALTLTNAYVAVQLEDLGLELYVQDAQLILSDTDGESVYATTAYVPAQMSWVRMRSASGTIVAESSPDGVAWSLVGSATSATSSSTRVGLIAGTSNFATTETAQFGRFVVCR